MPEDAHSPTDARAMDETMEPRGAERKTPRANRPQEGPDADPVMGFDRAPDVPGAEDLGKRSSWTGVRPRELQ